MTKLKFLTILALVAVFAVCLPFDPKDTPLMAKGLTTSDTLAIIGNSVLDHASRCDQDHRSISRMLADDTHQSALDLSFPGQSIDEAAVLAATALSNPSIQTIVFPVSLFALQEWDTDAIRIYALSRLIGPYLHMASLAERAASPGRFSGTPFHSDAAFEYDGRQYPDYQAVKTSYFDTEKSLMPCPENDGADLNFITAFYYHNYLEYPILPDNITLLATLNEAAVRHRKSLVVVMLPINYELIEKLGVRGGASLGQQVAAVIDALAAKGVNVVDLSGNVPDRDFADRWCACGHLLAPGREKVARQIANALPNSVRAMAAH